jgi:hypothetical protein
MNRLLIGGAWVVALGGCPTDTGNPYINARLHAHSSMPSAVPVGTQLGTIANTATVWIAAGAVAVTDAACAPLATSIAGAGIADYAATTPLLRIDDVAADDTLCGGRLALAAGTLPNGAPPELAGHTVLVTGQRAGDLVEYIIRTTAAGIVEIDDNGGAPFTIDGTAASLFVGFDVYTWLADVDLAGATGDPIVIDAATDPARTAMFEADLARGIELYYDADNDGSAEGADDRFLARGTAVAPP